MQVEAPPGGGKVQARSERRFEVQLSAMLRTGLLSMPVRILDLSRSGALIEAPCPPPNGGAVAVKREAFSVEARVMWVEGRRFGVRFDAPIRATELFVLLSRSRVAAEPVLVLSA